jgi:hypothetical protein
MSTKKLPHRWLQWYRSLFSSRNATQSRHGLAPFSVTDERYDRRPCSEALRSIMHKMR